MNTGTPAMGDHTELDTRGGDHVTDFSRSPNATGPSDQAGRPLPKMNSNRVFVGKRPAAQFARYLLNAIELDVIRRTALKQLDANDFSGFNESIKLIQAYNHYILDGQL